MTGTLSLMYDADGRAVLALRTADKSEARAIYEKLKEENVEAVFKKFRNRRSLDANAYAWVLINKIAEVIGRAPVDVYRDQIKNVGGNAELVCVQQKASDALIAKWERNGLGWQAETMSSKLDGCINVILYSGSSTYDTKQMSRLIDNLIQDCKELDIETLPPDRINTMLEEWNGKKTL